MEEYKKQIEAAEGWLMLGLPEEAWRELESIPSAGRGTVEFYRLAWEALGRQGRWEEALQMAEEWIERFPDHPGGWSQRSYALHELGRTKEALERLIPAADRFPQEWVIPYNLACYACRLGRLDEARDWLQKAVARSSRELIRDVALRDPDLEALWPEIRSWS